MDLRTKEELGFDLKHIKWNLENAFISFDEPKKERKMAEAKYT